MKSYALHQVDRIGTPLATLAYRRRAEALAAFAAAAVAFRRGDVIADVVEICLYEDDAMIATTAQREGEPREVLLVRPDAETLVLTEWSYADPQGNRHDSTWRGMDVPNCNGFVLNADTITATCVSRWNDGRISLRATDGFVYQFRYRYLV